MTKLTSLPPSYICPCLHPSELNPFSDSVICQSSDSCIDGRILIITIALPDILQGKSRRQLSTASLFFFLHLINIYTNIGKVH